MKLDYTLTYNDIEIDVTITLSYIPGSRGHRDRYGAPEEPDEPATFEVDTVEDQHGNDYDLTDSEYDEVLEKANLRWQDDEPDYDEERDTKE